MIKKLLAIEEQNATNLFCAITGVMTFFGYLFVMVFLDGVKEDNIALLIVAYCVLTYLVGRKYPQAAKNMLSCAVALCSVVTVVSNSGHYSAVAHTFFLCLIIAVAHYEVLQVLLNAASVLITNIIGIILFPEPYLKVHSMIVWIYIMLTYIAAVICALIVAHRTNNLFKKEQQLHLSELELTHLEQVEKKNEEHNKFIHNMRHYFTAIGSLAAEQDCDEILNILNDLNVEITKQQCIFFTSNRVMNAIFVEKFSRAKDQGISMDIYVEPKVRLANVSDGDIVIMLENLLVNAIEAAKRADDAERFIKVRIYHENEGRICVIKIENSFSTPIKYNKKGSIVSGKKQGLHGYGLKSVNQTAEKYGGYLQCSAKDNVFTSVLFLAEELSDKKI